MKKIILYSLILFAAFTACEDVYYPDIDQVENVLVIDARIEATGGKSFVRLTSSLGFNESEYGYQPVSGANVTLMANDGADYTLYETADGIFPVYFNLNPKLEYKLRVEHSGNVYESSFEMVPVIPDIDTVFGVPETRYFLQGGENDINRIIEREGVQLYSDILYEKKMPYYRFTARKILEYTYTIEVGMMEIIIFGWRSSFPSETFNIAAPPEFSVTTDILKHPLYFVERSPFLSNTNEYNGILQASTTNFIGLILIVQQYGLSNSAYNYYKDLNSQLNSDGRLFDPLYVQASNNLKCTNDPQKIVLGNFEISSVKEHRFYVRYASEKMGYYLKPIKRYYPIPLEGETTQLPDFWEPR